MQIGQGREATRGVLEKLVSWFQLVSAAGFRSNLCYSGFLFFLKGLIWQVNASLKFWGFVRLHWRPKRISSNRHGSAGRGLGHLRFSFGLLCRYSEEGRGCERGRKQCTYLLFIYFTLGNRKESSKTLFIKAKVCQFPNQLFVASWFQGK